MKRELTVREAAHLCGLNISTIERDRKAGRFPNARRSDRDLVGTWLIPIGDLIAAGRYRPTPAAPSPEQQLEQAGVQAQLDAERRAHARTREELVRVSAELAAERRHVEQLLTMLSRLAGGNPGGAERGAA